MKQTAVAVLRGIRAVLLAVAIFAAASAVSVGAEDQPSFKLSGNLDAQAEANSKNEDSVFQRVTPFQEVTAGALIDGKLEFSRQYTTLGLLDFTFEEANVLDHESGAKAEDLSFLVNELYSDLNFSDVFFIRLGKQRLKWGAGFIFNPSDPVNPPKDPTALRAVREGVPALKAEVITKYVSLTGFGVFFDTLDQCGVGSKISTSLLPGSDVSVSGYYSKSESWTAALNASVAPLYEIPGWDTLQVWIEGSVYDKGRYAALAEGTLPGSVVTRTAGGTEYSILTGLSATLPEIRTVVMAEYYHLSEGLSQGQLRDVYRALRSSDPDVANESSGWYSELARRAGRQGADYLFINIEQPSITDNGDPVFDKIGLSASCLLSLTDLSFYLTGGISTTFVKDSSIDLSVSWANGGKDTEFGNTPSALAATLEVKVYF